MKFLNKQKGNVTASLAGGVAVLAVIGAAIYGYVMNIVALIDATSITGMVIARGIGAVIPFLGAILGYF